MRKKNTKKMQIICVFQKKAVPLHPLLKNQSEHGGLSSVGRASDCGSECRGFEPHIPPEKERL